MATEAELQTRYDALNTMIASGILRSTYQGTTLEYRNMDEMKAARADVRLQLLGLQGKKKIRAVRFYSTKGL